MQNQDIKIFLQFVLILQDKTTQIEQELKKGSRRNNTDLYYLVQFFYSDFFFQNVDKLSEFADNNRLLKEQVLRENFLHSMPKDKPQNQTNKITKKPSNKKNSKTKKTLETKKFRLTILLWLFIKIQLFARRFTLVLNVCKNQLP